MILERHFFDYHYKRAAIISTYNSQELGIFRKGFPPEKPSLYYSKRIFQM